MKSQFSLNIDARGGRTSGAGVEEGVDVPEHVSRSTRFGMKGCRPVARNPDCKGQCALHAVILTFIVDSVSFSLHARANRSMKSTLVMRDESYIDRAFIRRATAPFRGRKTVTSSGCVMWDECAGSTTVTGVHRSIRWP